VLVGIAAVAAALCPQACWALLARTRLIGAIVAALLVAAAAFGLAVTFTWQHWGARRPILVAYVPVTAVVMCAGVLVERRLTPPTGELISWRRFGGWLLLATFVVTVDVIGMPLVILTNVSHDIGRDIGHWR
jgi:hypothetical protein